MVSGLPLKPIRCIVYLMNTPKPSLFTVTLPSAPIPLPIVKAVKIVEEEAFPYKSFRYSLEGLTQNLSTFTEVASALANLISPMRELTAKELEQYPELEGWLIPAKIENDKVLKFLMTYGQFGLADISRRTQFKFGTKSIESEVKNFCAKVGIYGQKDETQTVAYYKKNPDEFRKRVLRIGWGTEVPYKWVIDDLRSLYRCVRILELLANKKEQGFKLEHSQELRRFIYANDRAPFVIPIGKDPGTYRSLDTKWKISEGAIQDLVENFTSNINRFLQPLTYNVMQTEKQKAKNWQLNSIETFLIYSICTTDGGFKEKFCLKETCRRPFYAQRISHVYHSETCASSMRQKRARAKQKVSVSKAECKATPKAKGRKSEQT